MIFTLMALKGGEGKTTIALNLADQYTQQGFNVCLVDADQSQNSFDFLYHKENKIFDFVKYENIEQVKKLDEKYDLVIIDNSNRINNLLDEIIDLSSFIIIPTKMSFLSNFTLQDLIKKIYSRGKEKQTGILFTFFRYNKGKDKEIYEEQFKKLAPDFHIFKQKISLSTQYENSINQLKTLREIKSNKVAEIQLLIQEIDKI